MVACKSGSGAVLAAFSLLLVSCSLQRTLGRKADDIVGGAVLSKLDVDAERASIDGDVDAANALRELSSKLRDEQAAGESSGVIAPLLRAISNNWLEVLMALTLGGGGLFSAKTFRDRGKLRGVVQALSYALERIKSGGQEAITDIIKEEASKAGLPVDKSIRELAKASGAKVAG